MNCLMPELVPEGSIPLTEAYSRYRSWLWAEHDPRTELDLAHRLQSLPQERMQLHIAGADKVTDLQLSEIVDAFASGEIEALVRMDRLDQIPPARLSAWFDSEARHASETTRRETLRVLSLTSDAQQYLLARAVDDDLSKGLRRAVIDMLVYRAEATQRTERFDFMSESDCAKILTLKDKLRPY